MLLSNTNPTEVLKVMRKLEANNNVLSKSNMINFQLKIIEMCSLKLWNTILDMSWRVQTYTTFKNNSKKIKSHRTLSAMWVYS